MIARRHPIGSCIVCCGGVVATCCHAAAAVRSLLRRHATTGSRLPLLIPGLQRRRRFPPHTLQQLVADVALWNGAG